MLGIALPDHVLHDVRTYGERVLATVRFARGRRAADTKAESPPIFHAWITSHRGRHILRRAGELTPYLLEEIAEDARRAGRGARIEVTAASADGNWLVRAQAQCAHLAARGVDLRLCVADDAGDAPARSRKRAA